LVRCWPSACPRTGLAYLAGGWLSVGGCQQARVNGEVYERAVKAVAGIEEVDLYATVGERGFA
jgi:hypothetical protein